MSEISSINKKGINPFADLIGLNFSEIIEGCSKCSIEITKDFFNPNGVVHGGVMFSMADTAMGLTVYSSLEKGENCATIEIKINYFKAVKVGTLFCSTKILNKGRSVIVLESEIYNDERLVAKAIGTFAVLKTRD
ncbi:MAG: PaaI family thioesterase [Acidobacteria bacterium]|nr:PaaI family thioesterase [Acidobacteriota bacterium]